uniref:Transcription factor MYB39-like n=1 Tax=Nelumbo nucifera TaxID=4432 RepID=A0A822ZHF8_NELNU|nr:TPA_asm: hypothetical protein HUJ06_015441 [Nelumbo nucifera]
MGRSPCCDENGLKKGPWTPEEDQKLVQYIQKHGHGSWRALPKLAGLNRCGKSCRLRWTNYLRPDIKRGKFSPEEEQTILNLHSFLGNKWSAIATHLPGRTDNEIKNFWNTHLKKKLIQMGFDPMTHRPRTDIFSNLQQLLALANLREFMDQQPWEEQAVRLQAEAFQMAKLQYCQHLLQTAAATVPASSSSNSLSSMTDMESFNLLNSISSFKDNPVLGSSPLDNSTLSSLGTAITSQSVLDPQVHFSHSPNLKPPCGFQTHLTSEIAQGSDYTAGFSQAESSPQSPWFPHSPSPPLLPPQPVPSTTQTAISNPGDACSTSSYGGGTPFWPELLLDDESFIQEIA